MTASPLLVCYGGTFDPVHNGHLAVARAVRDALSARVVLVPARDPPHKGPTRAAALQRARMLELAVADEPGLGVDRRELGRDGPSWTVDTLVELRRELGDAAPIAWLIGADSLRQLDSWHRWRSLFDLGHVIAVQRPGAAIDAATLRAQAATLFAEVAPRWRPPARLADAPCGGFALVPMESMRPESSSEIRRRIAAGEPWQAWVPPAVASYIVRHGLYRPAAAIMAASPSSDCP